MITVRRFIKQLNNTELGKGSTHDTYILVPQNVSIKGIFESPGQWISFQNIDSNETIDLKNTEGREKRVVGLGEYYRKNNLIAGDEVILERIIRDDKSLYRISCQKHSDYIVIQKFRDNFELLSEERLSMAEEWSNTVDGFSIRYLGEEHKRSDSPESTSVYRITIGGTDIANKYKNKDMVILKNNSNAITEWKSVGWKQVEYEMED